MKKKIYSISRFASFLDKSEVTVAYSLYHFYIFKDNSLGMLWLVRDCINRRQYIPDDIPQNFLDFLCEKNLITEDVKKDEI